MLDDWDARCGEEVKPQMAVGLGEGFGDGVCARRISVEPCSEALMTRDATRRGVARLMREVRMASSTANLYI